MADEFTPRDVYDCDGVAFEFPITFPVDRPADVYVELELATGLAQRMVRDQDYVVRKEDDDSLTVVTRVDNDSPPLAAGITIVIRRVMPFAQPSGRAHMSPVTFRNRLNSVTRMLQQIREQLDRTLHVGQAVPPVFLTSRPYPYEFIEAMAVSGDINSGRFAPLTIEAMDVSGDILSGTLVAPLIEYEDWPAEAMDVSGDLLDAGNTLEQLLLYYEDWPAEAMDVSGDLLDAGNTLEDLLLRYEEYPPEALAVSGDVLNGTLV